MSLAAGAILVMFQYKDKVLPKIVPQAVVDTPPEPPPEPPPPEPKPDFVVSVRRGVTYLLDGQIIDLADLAASLEEQRGDDTNRALRVAVGPDVLLDDFVSVTETLEAGGFEFEIDRKTNEPPATVAPPE